jgi:hypothetical protein
VRHVPSFLLLLALALGVSFASAQTAPSTAKAFYKIEQMSGWGMCAECAGTGGTGPTGTVSLTHNQTSPSLDGNSSKYFIGGSTPYTNALFWKKLITSTQASTNKATHHFIYDAKFYVKDATAVSGLEWDINQYVSGKFYLFGTQCGFRTSHTWDIYNNTGHKWVSTGFSCTNLKSYSWHHVIIEMERTTGDRLHYISVSLDGNKHYVNKYYYPTSTSYSAVTVNYQMDGNSYMTDYNTWLDKFSLYYW